MWDEMYAAAAIISVLASVAGLWSAIRRRQLMGRLLRSLTPEQLELLRLEIARSAASGASSATGADPGERGEHRAPGHRAPNVVDALARVVAELTTARRLLEEVYTIGLWSKSDDCSDNRRRRQGLRETDRAVSGALRALAELHSQQADFPASLSTLEEELRALVGVLEPLPDTVTDTMGDTLPLDGAVRNVADKVSKLLQQASDLAAEHRGQQAGDDTFA